MQEREWYNKKRWLIVSTLFSPLFIFITWKNDYMKIWLRVLLTIPIALLTYGIFFSDKNKTQEHTATLSPSQETAKLENTKPVEPIPSNPVDYSEFDYALPQSNYTYKIKITEIETKVAKDAFTTKADEYSVPKKVDGYFLTVKFAMTNPYDKEMMTPIPEYYYITSANGEWFSSSTTNHRECQCQIDNSTKITNLKGKELYQISEGRYLNDKYCFKFLPNETKEFKINFTDAVFGEVRKIVFNGFGLKWSNPSYTREQDKGLIIDIDNKKIIGEKKF